ncbi:MAG: hypothetical protein R3195_03340 [Gemmatimonadota bacterium]|nr:hypothetical protein [Gemmatimonadota bacterium]
MDLSRGEVQVLSDAASLRSFRLTGAGEGREYQIIVMSASQVEGGSTPLVFTVRASSVGASVAPTRLPSVARDRRPAARRTDLERVLERPRHLELRARMDAEVRRVGGLGSLGAGTSSSRERAVARNMASAATIPGVGDIVEIKSQVVPGGGLTCNSSATIEGVVKTVGDNFVIVEDPAVAGHLTSQDYADLDTELDAYIAPIDNEYFGDPADLDGNERVIVFFTGEVNRLNEPGSPGIIIGFFSPLDTIEASLCPSSNEAEIVWLIGPDPDGEIGVAIPTDLVKTISRGLVAHEYQHLLSDEARFVHGNGMFLEDLWLNEGLSHIAEEVSGLYRVGVGTRDALGFTEITPGQVGRPAFDDFHWGNLLNVGDYLEGPSDVVSLAGGAYPENQAAMRGWSYLFLRWLGDRFGPAGPGGLLSGSDEFELFRELARGGDAHAIGIENVVAAVNTVAGESLTWDEVLEQYFAAPAVEGTAAPDELQFSTWDYPRLYDELAANSVQGLSSGFPLEPTAVVMGAGTSSTANFDLGASTARYFRFTATGQHPDMIVEMTAPSGANVPNGARARVIVVRTG